MNKAGQIVIANINEKVSQLEDKLEKLIHERDELLSENMLLKQSQLRYEVEVKEWEKKYDTLKLAKSFVDGESNDSSEAKKKVARIVREIDKCIALLNR
ncbi:MAG: hypothetical protein N4A72_12650 [Bacteroidales bacterium]|jgi:hypothetical protein|nr:hypothetical protein [Bacteroidales bacterium]